MHHHHTTLHHNHSSWWRLALPIVLHPRQRQPSTPLYTYSTFEAKFKGWRLFWNDGWTKWEAVQLADELKAKWEMVKADWECWKEADMQREAPWICKLMGLFCLSGMTYLRRPFETQINVWDRDGMHTSKWKQRWRYHHTSSKAMRNGPPTHLPITIKLDPSMTKFLIRGNKGGQGGNRQGQLLVKTWKVVTTVPFPRMRVAQRRKKTTMKTTKAKSKLRIVW